MHAPIYILGGSQTDRSARASGVLLMCRELSLQLLANHLAHGVTWQLGDRV